LNLQPHTQGISKVAELIFEAEFPSDGKRVETSNSS
jgi:hypothetical protein